VAWVPRGENDYCETHDYEWSRVDGRACPTCLRERPPAPSPESDWSPPLPPEGCRSSVERERWLTEGTTYCHEQAKKLSGGVPGAKGRPNYSAAIKWMEAALKYARAASSFTETRERREYIKHLRKHAEALRRGAKR